MLTKPDKITLTCLDGDMLVYRAAFSTQDDTEQACKDKVDDLVEYIIGETVVFPTDSNMKVFLTGATNFRKSIDPSYKQNRKDVPKPKWLGAAREHMIERWGAVVSEMAEADDLIATEVAFHGDPETTVIASLDKDLKTVNSWFFNFRDGTFEYTTEEAGLAFFYQQCLMGDPVDGVVGVYGIGPKKSKKFLEDCTTEQELYDTCLKVYLDHNLLEADLIRNARMLHLQRYKGQIWQKPRRN